MFQGQKLMAFKLEQCGINIIISNWLPTVKSESGTYI